MSKITNKLPAKLKAKPIQIKIEGTHINEYASNLGNLPFVWFNGFTLDLNDISYLELSIENNLPTLKLTFKDGLNILRDKSFPLDDSKFSIFINPRSTQLKPIHMDFKIVDFKIVGKNYSCVGVIDVNKLHIKEFKSYSKSSSFQVLSTICKQIGLGFNSNMNSTNDTMTWINPGQKIQQFMDTVVENSHIGDRSFVFSYIDYYYNYTYVDVQKELLRNIKEELGVTNIGIESIFKSLDRDTSGQLLLTNDNAYYESNVYFEKFTILNKSTSVSLSTGHKSVVKFYNAVSKEYTPFTIDSVTDDSQSKIPLKGFPKDKSLVKENLNYIYAGKFDPDNMHKNYLYGKHNNDRNLFDLEKVSIEIEMRLPNFNFYKFQKVLVVISNQSRNLQEEWYNERLSGEWLIVDIRYKLFEMKFTQYITLVKRELELSESELRG